MKKLITLLAATLFATGAMAQSTGATIDMSDTSPTASGTGWTLASGVYTISNGADVTVIGNNGGSGRRILIQAGATARITLNGTTITGTTGNTAPIGLDNNTNLTLILADGTINTLSGANTEACGIQQGLAGQTNNTSILTIEGNGTLNATGGSRWPGIGGRAAGSRTINIKSGIIIARGGGEGAGIGNGRSTPANSSFINISGGVITATGGNYSAGIGGGDNVNSNDNGGAIVITGGIITANGGTGGAGIGNGRNNGWGTTLRLDGNAIVFASSITDTGTSNKLKGILFIGTTGTMYGDVTPTADFTIPGGSTLTIGSGQTLTIDDGITLTNNGTIANSGTFTNSGTIANSGTFTNSGTINCSTGNISGTLGGNLANYTGATFPTNLTATFGQTLSEISPTGNGTSGAAQGDFTWATPSDYVGNAGQPQHNMNLTLTHANAANYRVVTDNVSVTVNKAAPADTDLSFTIPTGHVYNGAAQGIGSVTPAAGITGLGVITVLYNGSPTPPVSAGTYTVTADIASGSNYTAATLPLGSYTIASATSSSVTSIPTLNPAGLAFLALLLGGLSFWQRRFGTQE
ncbi:MAG: IPTL-CTERM sorting domain-containing protein [Burkholderiales bacterium]|jgi:hypothetical protein|nr:IPTL-CTERM sorting domain-containing protein [Burkholderiales bacterium]